MGTINRIQQTTVKHQPGFTLLEMLLVLIVIAVMASLVSVTIGQNPYNTLDREAKRLQAVLQMAADEAVLQAVQWSLALPEQGYQFLMFDSENFNWKRIETEPYNLYTLDNSLSLTLTIEGEQLDPQTLKQIQRMQSLNTEQTLQPALLLLSSGEISPFNLTLTHKQINESITLHSDGVSPIEIIQRVRH